jgi:hypothetical protein
MSAAHLRLYLVLASFNGILPMVRKEVFKLKPFFAVKSNPKLNCDSGTPVN